MIHDASFLSNTLRARAGGVSLQRAERQADAIREVFEKLSDDQGGVGLLG